ncbi:MAG: protein kinase [Vicinamibacterales bacterium]
MSMASEPACGAGAEDVTGGYCCRAPCAVSTAAGRARRTVPPGVLRCFGPQGCDGFRPSRSSPLTEDRSLFDGPRATYGRFRLLHQIGAGSVGPVFRGEDGETRQRVVIKVIRVGLPPEKVAALASALSALKARWPAHPGLAPMIETGVVDVEPYVVTPWIDGDSLDVALRDYGPAHLTDALPRLRRLAEAIDTASAAGWHHGSLHLRDIMVSVEQTVLTGMGLAPLLEKVGVRPPVRRPYSAPEVVQGGVIGRGTDQFALAAIAHEWLSGRRLSGGGASGFHVPASTPQGADALREVFERALADDADDRYPSALAFVEALGARLGDVAERRTARSGRRGPATDLPRLSFDDAPDTPADDTRLTFAPLTDGPAATAPITAGAELGHDDRAVDDDVVPEDDDMAPEDDDVAPAGPPAVSGGPMTLGDIHAHDDLVGETSLRHGGDDDVDDDPLDEPVLAGGGPSLDDEDPVDHGHAPALSAAPDDDIATDDTVASPPADGSRWALWAGALVLAVLVIVGAGWGLLRWGTPAAAPSSTASARVPVAAPVAPAPEPPASATMSTAASASAPRPRRRAPRRRPPARPHPRPRRHPRPKRWWSRRAERRRARRDRAARACHRPPLALSPRRPHRPRAPSRLRRRMAGCSCGPRRAAPRFS